MKMAAKATSRGEMHDEKITSIGDSQKPSKAD